jgi:serine protease Do
MLRRGRVTAMAVWLCLEIGITLGILGAHSAPAAAQDRLPVASSATETARSTLDRARPSVIQINGFSASNSAPSSHGTGFAVATGGYFITNYHVVSEHVQDPDKHRLEYKTPDGRSGPLRVLSVDVRNDLAIAVAADHAPDPLVFAEGAAGKGERAYSIGYPLDVGLTITEGVSNGHVDGQFVPRIHYSGALNGGMSGGPALNSTGQVIGVNVSHYRFQQSISFFVPAEQARALVASTLIASREAMPDGLALKAAVVAQAKSHGNALLQGLAGRVVTEVTAGYRLPSKLAPFVDCNANASTSATASVQSVRIACSAKAQIYLGQSLTTGKLVYAHTILTSAKLDPWRFAHRLSPGQTHQAGNLKHVGPLACETKVVALKGFDADVSICTRAYRKLTGLYDLSLRVTSVSGAAHGFTSSLDMAGMDFDSGMAFIRHYLDAMERAS